MNRLKIEGHQWRSRAANLGCRQDAGHPNGACHPLHGGGRVWRVLRDIRYLPAGQGGETHCKNPLDPLEFAGFMQVQEQLNAFLP